MSTAHARILAAIVSIPMGLQTSGPAPTRHDIAATFDTATGLLLIPVTVNGARFRCNLDSGFSALFTLDERLASNAHLTPGPASPTPDGRPPTPGDREARATVVVGDVVLRDRQVILRAFPPEAPDMQCVMGAAVLRQFVVEFDYEAPRVHLYPRSAYSAPHAAAIPLNVRRNTPFVDVELQLEDGRRQHASMVVDTGASYFSAVLMPEFVDHTGALARTRTARWPSAGRLRPLAARFAEIRVGPWTLPAQIGALLDTAIGPGMDDGLLGSAFLQQFTVAIDFDGARLYLTPNKRFGTAQTFDASGVAFRRTADAAAYEVAFVADDSPAWRAGLRQGDRLLRINGMETDNLTGVELRDLFSRPDVTMTLELIRGGAAVTTAMRLETRL